ncbi:hypothetical protein E7V67_019870 [[Empedobacter] haloabium]|uniref:Uncharacterized protein n=1 Tax=[Empedobacter] haloabium TaxID=592317 RepID=A0ABZ1UI95_9BURK
MLWLLAPRKKKLLPLQSLPQKQPLLLLTLLQPQHLLLTLLQPQLLLPLLTLLLRLLLTPLLLLRKLLRLLRKPLRLLLPLPSNWPPKPSFGMA